MITIRNQNSYSNQWTRSSLPLILLSCSHPPLKGSYRYLPLSYYRQSEASDGYQSQLDKYNKIIVSNNSDANARFERAVLYMGVGKYSAAEEDLSIAISSSHSELNTDKKRLSSMYLHRGLVRWGTKNVDKAIEDYTEAIKLTPDNWEPYFHRWQAYRYTGQMEKAEQDHDHGIKLKPSVFEKQYSFTHGII